MENSAPSKAVWSPSSSPNLLDELEQYVDMEFILSNDVTAGHHAALSPQHLVMDFYLLEYQLVKKKSAAPCYYSVPPPPYHQHRHIPVPQQRLTDQNSPSPMFSEGNMQKVQHKTFHEQRNVVYFHCKFPGCKRVYVKKGHLKNHLRNHKGPAHKRKWACYAMPDEQRSDELNHQMQTGQASESCHHSSP